MKRPPFVYYKTEGEYREHFEREYCGSSDPIFTFDGIKVDFYPGQFKHAFFESSSRGIQDKANFSWERAKRIDRIKSALQNPKAELYVGYDKKTKSITHKRRVSITVSNYVVVIQLKSNTQASFITAF